MRKLLLIIVSTMLLASPIWCEKKEPNMKIQQRIVELQQEGQALIKEIQKIDDDRQQKAQRLNEIVGALKELQELNNDVTNDTRKVK